MNTYNTFFGFYALSNTPLGLDSEENNSHLEKIKKLNIDDVILETSSHELKQNRLNRINKN